MADTPPPSQEIVSRVAGVVGVSTTPLQYSLSLLKLSQVPADDLAAAKETLKAMLAHLEEADKVAQCSKTVYFDRSVPRHDPLWIHCGKLDAHDKSSVRTTKAEFLKDILEADFLVVSAATPSRNFDAYDAVEDVTIAFESATITTPKWLIFASGSRFGLSDGYSVRNCHQLFNTTKMGTQ